MLGRGIAAGDGGAILGDMAGEDEAAQGRGEKEVACGLGRAEDGVEVGPGEMSEKRSEDGRVFEGGEEGRGVLVGQERREGASHCWHDNNYGVVICTMMECEP